MADWVREVFSVQKPVIAMLHLSALPGDPPGFDTRAGLTAVVDRAKEELDALQQGGVDGVMISNEFSLPYLTKTEPITAITMARIIGQLLGDISILRGSTCCGTVAHRSTSPSPPGGHSTSGRSSPASTPAISGCGTPTSARSPVTAPVSAAPGGSSCSSTSFPSPPPTSLSAISRRSPARRCSPHCPTPFVCRA